MDAFVRCNGSLNLTVYLQNMELAANVIWFRGNMKSPKFVVFMIGQLQPLLFVFANLTLYAKSLIRYRYSACPIPGKRRTVWSREV